MLAAAALPAMTSQPASLNPLVVAATHQVLKVELLPWEPTAALHQGPGGMEAPLAMISTEVSLVEGEAGAEVVVMAMILVGTAVGEEEAVEAMEEVAATIGRVEAGVMVEAAAVVTVEEEVWRRSSQTTRSLSRDFPLTPQRRT